MKPIGLTMKDSRYNPFTDLTSGEPAIVHQCLRCNRISCNRIAGDDNPHSIISLISESAELNVKIQNILTNMKISLLTGKDLEPVLICLFGNNYAEKYI